MPFQNTMLTLDERIADLLDRLSLEEKIKLLSGPEKGGFIDKPGNARLGIPSLHVTDGPHGVWVGESTCFPASVALAASWNEGLLKEVGAAIAREARAKGRNVLLAPCINIHRQPFGGRNFESFSEDPYLASRMTVGYVQGVQSQNVIATLKHFACNNQETERGSISVEVDSRALHEIYLPAFKAGVQEANALAVMAAYNRVQGTYVCENINLLTTILRQQWGFRGFVISDWGAMKSTKESIKAGCDIEMPMALYYGNELLKAVQGGEVPESVIDQSVCNILRALFEAGLFDRPASEFNGLTIDHAEHRFLALKAARESIVLLKNNGVLPLKREKLRSIAIIGPNADKARIGGWGSSLLRPTYNVSPLEGILKKAGNRTQVRFQRGCDIMDLPGNYESIPRSYFVPADSPAGESGLKGEYFTGTSFAGEPFKTQVDPQIDFDWNYRQPVPGLEHDKFSVRWTGQMRTPGDGSRQLAMASFGPAKLYVDGLLVLDLKESNRHEAATVSPELQAGRNYDIKVEYAGKWGGSMCRLGWMRTDADPVAEAAQLASECDIAIVFAGLSEVYEGESFDRSTLALPGLQNKLIEAVAKANPRTIVVLNNGTPILMDWKDNVAAIVEAWYPGQEGGLAIAEVLFGEINPSGKLPFTFPKCWNDHSAYGNFPGKDGVVKYVESIFVGYRHFDLKEIEPLFPFGHGLSYTQFDYKDITISPGTITRGENVNVSVTLKNTGKCYGSEVVQLYIRDIEAAVARPMKELKGISKISLEPGETKKASFTLQPDAFSYYDSLTDKWITEPGKFIIMAGSSSRDIRLKKNVQVN